MKINVSFAVFIDVIEFNPFLEDNVEDYTKAFEKWYYVSDGSVHYGRRYVPFKYLDGETIVFWMNEISTNCNARIVKYHIPPEQEDLTFQGMYF